LAVIICKRKEYPMNRPISGKNNKSKELSGNKILGYYKRCGRRAELHGSKQTASL
jgi:hypothetical protein